MNPEPRICVDFQSCYREGSVPLTSNGSIADLKKYQIELKHGLELLLDDKDGHVIIGVAEFSEEENRWVALFDPVRLRNIDFFTYSYNGKNLYASFDSFTEGGNKQYRVTFDNYVNTMKFPLREDLWKEMLLNCIPSKQLVTPAI